MPALTNYLEARRLITEAVQPVGTERLPLASCSGRILAQTLIAADNVPPFDRSPFDGYVLRAEDTLSASRENPVTLRILEELPASSVPKYALIAGTASKILTGAPIPEGVRRGDLLTDIGTVIDPGVMGSLAGQNVVEPLVYRRPRVGIISTGSELVELGHDLSPGKIRDTNRYSMAAAIGTLGAEPVFYKSVGDSVDRIADAFREALRDCDAVISTGGVSVGDYDLTPAALEKIGAEILFRKVDLKPGMACAYALYQGKLICGLSGNPASSITNYYAIALPAFRKLCGIRDYELKEFPVTLAERFGKRSPSNRLLRGFLALDDGTVKMHLSKGQGNVMISGLIGCNVAALVPAGSGPMEAGTVLQGFLLT